MLGNGPSSDVHLRHFDSFRQRTRFSSPHVHTASTLAAMIRAMDVLDFETASRYSARLADPSRGHHSWIVVVAYRSLLGVLCGDVGIEGKRLQQAIDTNHASLPTGGVLCETLPLIQVCLHLAQGQTHLAQNILLDADSESPYISLAKAQLHLTIGEHRIAAHMANRVLSQKSLDLHSRATARAIQAASLESSGDQVEAESAFVDALEYCRITASLIPVALIPKFLRDQLIQRNSRATEWDLIAPAFADASGFVDEPGPDDTGRSGDSIGRARGPGGPGGPERLRQRLLNLGETLRIRADHTLLSPPQRRLLALLDTQSSVSAIAAELNLAEGTVKNKVSNLYTHLGVRNRRDALTRGYEYGYLPAEH